jgi:outer membrane immunogenic protein
LRHIPADLIGDDPMKKLFLLATAPVLAVAFASPAAAQPAGFRIEGVAGYDELRIDLDGAGAGTRQDVHGAVYGVGVGYDFPLGTSLAIGPEVEVTEATTDRETAGAAGNQFTVRRDVTVGGRLTAGIGNNFNAYARLGYSNLVVRTQPNNGALPINADTLKGIRGAAGVQFSDESRAYYGFELRYTDYGDDVVRRQAALVLGVRF